MIAILYEYLHIHAQSGHGAFSLLKWVSANDDQLWSN